MELKVSSTVCRFLSTTTVGLLLSRLIPHHLVLSQTHLKSRFIWQQPTSGFGGLGASHWSEHPWWAQRGRGWTCPLWTAAPTMAGSRMDGCGVAAARGGFTGSGAAVERMEVMGYLTAAPPSPADRHRFIVSRRAACPRWGALLEGSGTAGRQPANGAAAICTFHHGPLSVAARSRDAAPKGKATPRPYLSDPGSIHSPNRFNRFVRLGIVLLVQFVGGI
jgi:hypothetical protein